MHSHGLEAGAALFVESGSRFLSASRVSEQLGISQAELAKLVGVARNTLSAKAASRRVDAALSPIVRILALASEMAGDESRAAIWFKHQPIPGWAGKTAYDLVGQGKAETVLAYLESVRAGVYA
jgi:transcriptional regulator with XRE-family HTH domain